MSAEARAKLLPLRSVEGSNKPSSATPSKHLLGGSVAGSSGVRACLSCMHGTVLLFLHKRAIICIKFVIQRNSTEEC